MILSEVVSHSYNDSYFQKSLSLGSGFLKLNILEKTSFLDLRLIVYVSLNIFSPGFECCLTE